jgi:hypothetical protein
MTGFKDWNVPLMENTAKELRKLGHSVLVPIPDKDINVAMPRDCAMVCEVDTIVMCPGWEKSDGCWTEWRLAVRCKKSIYYINGKFNKTEFQNWNQTRWVLRTSPSQYSAISRMRPSR